jgi:hypothetical protein
MNQIEFLLRLSENARDKGDDIDQRYEAEKAAHLKELKGLWQMIEAARSNVWAELSRFGGLNEVRKEAQQVVEQSPMRSIGANNAARAKVEGEAGKDRAIRSS